MIIEMFSLIHIVMIVLLLLFIISATAFLVNKDEKTQKRFINILLFVALLSHFLKLFFPPYNNDDLAFRKITFENICAVSVLTFPFIFNSKSKALKDYMFYLGVISGVLAVIFPIEALGKNFFTFDAIRFYIVHMIIAIAPFLMVACNLHELNYHRIYKVPMVFIAVLGLILINEIILMELGLVPLRNDNLLDQHAYRNFSFIFGVSPEFKNYEKILTFFTPKVFTKIPFGEFKGEPKFWPLVWLIIPAFIYIGLLSLILSLYWEIGHIKSDFKSLINK